MVDDKVVGLRGEKISVREVCADTVSAARELLEMAEAGEIVGLVSVFQHSDGCVARSRGGAVGGAGIVGMLDVARFELISSFLGGDDYG